jgi:hypothetical protein
MDLSTSGPLELSNKQLDNTVVPDWGDAILHQIIGAELNSRITLLCKTPQGESTPYALFLGRIAGVVLNYLSGGPVSEQTSFFMFMRNNPIFTMGYTSAILTVFSLGMIAERDGWFRKRNGVFIDVPRTTNN